MLAAAGGDEAFRRATRELRLFAAVRSPHLVRLYDAGQEGDRFFYAMEYFPLGSLDAPAQALTPAQIRRAVADASGAAHALHEAGIVHRGIKPANILLHEDGARLSDLGLARQLNPGQSVTGVGPIEAIEYLDPAILRGERGSRASDIWSLGVTLHRALSGTGIYGDLPAEPLLAVRRVLSTVPEIVALPTPADTEIVTWCLDPDPAARPPTAAALAERLEG